MADNGRFFFWNFVLMIGVLSPLFDCRNPTKVLVCCVQIWHCLQITAAVFQVPPIRIMWDT